MFGYMRPEQTGLRSFYFFVQTRANYTSEKHVQVMSWCQDQFGLACDARWSCYCEGSFFFNRASDATAFRMRWC